MAGQPSAGGRHGRTVAVLAQRFSTHRDCVAYGLSSVRCQPQRVTLGEGAAFLVLESEQAAQERVPRCGRAFRLRQPQRGLSSHLVTSRRSWCRRDHQGRAGPGGYAARWGGLHQCAWHRYGGQRPVGGQCHCIHLWQRGAGDVHQRIYRPHAGCLRAVEAIYSPALSSVMG